MVSGVGQHQVGIQVLLAYLPSHLVRADQLAVDEPLHGGRSGVELHPEAVTPGGLGLEVDSVQLVENVAQGARVGDAPLAEVAVGLLLVLLPHHSQDEPVVLEIREQLHAEVNPLSPLDAVLEAQDAGLITNLRDNVLFDFISRIFEGRVCQDQLFDQVLFLVEAFLLFHRHVPRRLMTLFIVLQRLRLHSFLREFHQTVLDEQLKIIALQLLLQLLIGCAQSLHLLPQRLVLLSQLVPLLGQHPQGIFSFLLLHLLHPLFYLLIHSLLHPCFLAMDYFWLIMNVEGVPALLLDADYLEPETIALDLHFGGGLALQVVEEIGYGLALLLDIGGERRVVEEALLDVIGALVDDSEIDVGGLVDSGDGVRVGLQLEGLLQGLHKKQQTRSDAAKLIKVTAIIDLSNRANDRWPCFALIEMRSINLLLYSCILPCFLASLRLAAIQLVIKMKPALMRAPAISQIYNQKVTYENHLRKLQRIREERKQVLNVDHSRHMQLQQIKDGRSRTFAHKFNENNLQINQSNLKLLTKLENVKSFARYTSYLPSDRPHEATPKPLPAPAKRKIIETEKENSRIFFRMRSVSSNLSKDRLLSEYAKAEKIKSRITKYALENNKVALKSEKYFAHNKSNLSSSSLQSSHTERQRSPASFYRKEDIIRNRVIKTDIKSAVKRGFPTLGKGGDFAEDKAFFTTEPLKSKRATSKRGKA